MNREREVAWGFVGVQVALLLAIVLLPSGSRWRVSTPIRDASAVLEWAGLAIAATGLLGLGRSLTALPTPLPNAELKTGGAYRFVRHPVYSGLMLFAVGSATPSGSVFVGAAALGLIAWLTVKARWEERRLLERYSGYAAYAAATPRFVPWWPGR